MFHANSWSWSSPYPGNKMCLWKTDSPMDSNSRKYILIYCHGYRQENISLLFVASFLKVLVISPIDFPYICTCGRIDEWTKLHVFYYI